MLNNYIADNKFFFKSQQSLNIMTSKFNMEIIKSY